MNDIPNTAIRHDAPANGWLVGAVYGALFLGAIAITAWLPSEVQAIAGAIWGFFMFSVLQKIPPKLTGLKKE